MLMSLVMSKIHLFVFNFFAKQYFLKGEATLAVQTQTSSSYIDIFIVNLHLKDR